MIFSFMSILCLFRSRFTPIQCNIITGNVRISIEIFALNTSFFFSSLSDIKISKILRISDNRVRKRKFGIYTSLSFRVCECVFLFLHVTVCVCVCVRIDMVRRDCYYILAAIDADICDLFCLLCFYYPCYWLTVWFIARREFNIKPIATFDFCFILCIKHTSDKAPKKSTNC